jgi:hypothetical protein
LSTICSRHAAQIAAAADDELGLGHLDGATADIQVAGADRLRDPGQRDAIGLQLPWIDHHLILLDEPADRGDLGDPLGCRQLISDEPILQGAQFCQRLLGAHDDVLIDPAHAGGVRPERRREAGRESLLGKIQILEDTAPRPIDVGAVLENHVHERHAKVREPADHLGARHGEKRRRQRIGHLVFDDLWRLARIFGVDDDLGVREIRNGIQRRLEHRVDTDADDEQRRKQDQEDVARGEFDQAGDHLARP